LVGRNCRPKPVLRDAVADAELTATVMLLRESRSDIWEEAGMEEVLNHLLASKHLDLTGLRL
jgi:hypothetical protein